MPTPTHSSDEDGTPRVELRDGGWLEYQPGFLDPIEANRYLQALGEIIPWHQEGSRGRLFPRLVAWCADPGVVYTYSGIRHEPSPWRPELLRIRERIEQIRPAGFNSVLLNLYRNGRDSMGYHADAEPELGPNPLIASVSLGAPRRFILKHTGTGELRAMILEPGSLLWMGGTCQHFWKHALPKTRRIVGERINLTFRRVVQQSL